MESRTIGRGIAAAVLVVSATGVVVWWWSHRVAPRPIVPVSSPAVKAPAGTRIIVEVVNGTGVRGLARQATFFLRDAGFDVVRYASDTLRRDSTLVVDRSGHPDWAQAVAKALGGARMESRPDSSRYLDVTVFLGTSWRPPPQPLYP
ncbi:MAG: LytR C-terminal domain-containing protein [Gemmatimonadaceae bacterium]